MNKLALAAVVLLPLVSGCVSSSGPPMEPPAGSVTIYWNFQSWDYLIAGDYTSSNSGCELAGVQEVDLDIYDAANVNVYYQSHYCQADNGVPGAVVTLAPGSYTFYATAYRGRDHYTAVSVFSSAGSFNVASGLDTPVDTTLDILVDGLGHPLPQSMLVLYSKAGVVTCSGVSGVHYSFSDVVGPVEAGTVTCDPYNELLVQGASVLGTTYTIDYLQLLDPGGFSINEVCALPVLHNGFAAIIDLPPTSTPGCF
jgi:hypothetical protein